MITIKQFEKKQHERRKKNSGKLFAEWEKISDQFTKKIEKLKIPKNDYDTRNYYWREWGFQKKAEEHDKKIMDQYEKRRLKEIKELETLAMLLKRYKHQSNEVKEAKQNLGKPGFTKAYLQRMSTNAEQTKRMIKKYEK